MLRVIILGLAMVAALPARGNAEYRLPDDPMAARFVASNLVAVFYHELGHALIDVLMLPVVGSEEDAADTLSALFMHRFQPDGAADALVADTALGFRLYAERQDSTGEAFRGPHALDLQRQAALVCLYYGADPSGHAAAARALGLADAGRASCREEFDRAAAAWESMLADHPPQDGGRGLRMVAPRARDPYTRLIAAEVAAFNAEFGLPVWVDVTVERCGEANAFYDLRARRIVMCIEYAEDLARLHAARREGL
jgi:hypothetical protein